MNPTLLAVLGGCVAGFGVWLFTRALVPSRVDMAAVFATDRTPRPNTPALPVEAQPDLPGGVPGRRVLRGWQSRLEVRLAATGLRSPDADLTVVDLGRGPFLLIRVCAAFGGLLIAPVYTLLFAFFEAQVPTAVPLAVGVALGVVGWFVPGALVHNRAEVRRREMRYALVSYLTLVALYRAAGEGIGSALDRAARTSAAWTFRRISDRIESSARGGEAPWDGLARLAGELGIDELADLAGIADLAATGGAGVYATLLARARGLRHELQTREEAAAAIRSARLVVPKAMLGIVTLLFLLYPAVMSIGGT